MKTVTRGELHTLKRTQLKRHNESRRALQKNPLFQIFRQDFSGNNATCQTCEWEGFCHGGAYTDFVYRLNDTGDMREFIEGYKYDDLEEIEGGPWFRAIPTGEMDEGFYEMNYEPITEAEAEGMMEKYTIQSLRWSMLAD